MLSWSYKYFVRAIIVSFGSSSVMIISVSFLSRTVSIVYNFVFKNKIYFYLGVFRHEDEKKLKPGLLTHTLSIEDYIARGFDFYDFMGGSEQYKAQLGLVHNEICQFSLKEVFYFTLLSFNLKN